MLAKYIGASSVLFLAGVISPVIITFASWTGAFFFRFQLIKILLCLELVLLGLFFSLLLTMTTIRRTRSVCFYLIVIGASEARVGLSLLVLISRLSGGDSLKLVRALKS